MSVISDITEGLEAWTNTNRHIKALICNILELLMSEENLKSLN